MSNYDVDYFDEDFGEYFDTDTISTYKGLVDAEKKLFILYKKYISQIVANYCFISLYNVRKPEFFSEYDNYIQEFRRITKKFNIILRKLQRTHGESLNS